MNQRIVELALIGLQAEREKIEQEIADLRRQMNGGSRANHSSRATAAPATGGGRKRGGGISAAGRRRLAEAAKRRWAVSRRLGKTTL